MDTKLQHFFEQIGRNVKSARESRGKNLSELARIANINKGTLSKIESGKLGASVEMLMTIAEALGLHVFQLMMEEEDVKALKTLTRNIADARPPAEIDSGQRPRK